MRKIVAGLFISLDGVVEAPHEWHFPYHDEEMSEAVEAQMAETDTILLGRVTYEAFASYWPHQGDDMPGAAHMNGTPKLVASTTLDKVEWQNATLIKGDVAKELTRLKQQPGKNIGITGSATLIRSLMRAGVLDELTLFHHPIVVGHGQRLFDDIGEQIPLKLADSKTFSTGALRLTYVPAEK